MTKTLDLHWVTETVANPPLVPDVIVDGMLRESELCVVGAPRAIGKSFFVGNLAVLVGRGQGRLLGVLNVRRSARVLVCNGELRPWQTARRWQMLTGGKDVPEGVAESFDRWKVGVERRKEIASGIDSGVRAEREWWQGRLDERLRETVEANRFDVLILDAWASFFSGEENSNDQTEAALGKLQELSDKTGVAIVIIHHFGKSNEGRDREDLWRGASRLADWANTRVTLLPRFRTDKEAADAHIDPTQRRRYVNVAFLRNDEPTDPIVAKLGENGWWDEVRSLEPTEPPRRLTPEDAAQACTRDGGWPSATEATKALRIGREPAAVLLRQTEEAGLIVRGSGPRGTKTYRPAAGLTDSEQQVLDLASERRRREDGR
jgi:hypothetical protein